MKRVLYAVMGVRLGIASLSPTGCGKKKESVKQQRVAVSAQDDMTDEELLAALNEIEESELEEALEEEDEEELDEELAEEELEEELEDIYKGMTPEEIEEAERLAMEELAALIAQEHGNGNAMAMGPDAFDLASMSPEEQAEFAEYQKTAAAWAQQELALAAEESAALGFTRIEFEKNSSAMLPGQEAALANNIKCARAALEQGRDLVIGAHAEQNAPQALELSNARAAVLRDALTAAGLDANHIHAAGYGNYLLDAASQSAAEVIVC